MLSLYRHLGMKEYAVFITAMLRNQLFFVKVIAPKNSSAVATGGPGEHVP